MQIYWYEGECLHKVEFYILRIGLVHQDGRREFIVLELQ